MINSVQQTHAITGSDSLSKVHPLGTHGDLPGGSPATSGEFAAFLTGLMNRSPVNTSTASSEVPGTATGSATSSAAAPAVAPAARP